MSVIYDSKKIIPAPIVRVSKQYQTAGDGTKIGAVFQLVLTGTLVAWKGSPLGLTSPGGGSYDGWQNRFWVDTGYPPDEVVTSDQRLRSLLAKQKALRVLFATDGLSLEFTPLDGSTPMKCYPRVQSIDFQEGIWYDRVDYTITLEADCLLLDGVPICEDEFDEYISAASESWTMASDENNPESANLPRTYTLSHTVSATGKRFFDSGSLSKPAWEQARDFVLPRLGIDADRIFASGVQNLPGYYTGYNLSRSENVDELNGTYSVTETWIVASGSALETFEISIRKAADNGLTTVGVNGTVTGLEQRNNDNELTVHKYTNANTKFNYASGVALTRAQNYSGLTLNPIPLNTSIGKNPVNGVINYSFDYDDRPTNCIPGALSESIVVQDTLAGDVFASVFVLGRTSGPVLQDLGAKTATRRSLSIELVMPKLNPGSCTLSALRSAMNDNPRVASATSAAVNNIIAAANPANFTTFTATSQNFTSEPQESWDYKNGRYTYTQEWTYEI